MPASITQLHGAATGRWPASLAAASDEALLELLELRPELQRVSPASYEALAGALVSPASAMASFQRLDRAARQALEALCVLKGTAPPERLAAVLGCARDELDPVLDRLRRFWLAIEDGGALVANPGVVAGVRHPAGLGRSYQSLLSTKTSKELGEIAARLGVASRGPKPTLVEAIGDALADPDALAAAFESAPDGAEELARRMAASGPVLQLGYSYSAYERYDSERSASGWLLRRGMLVSPSWGIAEMPAEVALALRGGLVFPDFSSRPPPLATSPVDQDAVDAAGTEAALRLVRDVVSLLGSLGEVPAKLLKDGGIGVRELRRLGKACDRDESQTALLLELCAAAGLLGIEPYEEVALPTPAFDRFLEQPSWRRWRVLVAGWLEAPLELGIAGSSDSDGKLVPPLVGAGGDGSAAARRLLFCRLVATLPAGHAGEAPSLANLASWLSPTLCERPASSALLRAQRFLAECALLGVSASAAPTAFGRLLLGGDLEVATSLLEKAAPPVVRELVLQADLTVIAPGELPHALRSELALLADLESSGAAAVYRFSERSLQRGLDAGRPAAHVLGFLERHAPRGVPQALRYLIEDLGRRHGRLRVGAASCYLRSEEPSLLAEILSTRRLSRLGLRALAPTVLVSAAPAEKVEAALRDAGYLAAAEEPDGTLSVRRPPQRRVGARGARPGWSAASGATAPGQGSGGRHAGHIGLDLDLDLDRDRDLDLDLDLDLDIDADIDPALDAELGEYWDELDEVRPEDGAHDLGRGRDPDAAPGGSTPGGSTPGGSTEARLDAARAFVAGLRAGASPFRRPQGSARQLGSARQPGTGRAAPAPGRPGGREAAEVDQDRPGGAGARLGEPIGPGSWPRSGAGRRPRPGTIADGPAAIYGLLAEATSNDWGVRACYRDDLSGATRELYGRPLALHHGIATFELPDGELEPVPATHLVWVRVLTEAEEEANGLVEDW